jgi:hypothetical protein
MTDSLFKNGPKPVETAAAAPSAEQRQDLGSALLCHLAQVPSSKDGVSSRAYDAGPAPNQGGLRQSGLAALRADAFVQAAHKVAQQLALLSDPECGGICVGALRAKLHELPSMATADAREFVAELERLVAAFPDKSDFRWAVGRLRLASIPILLVDTA